MRMTLEPRAPIPWWIEVVGILIGVPWAIFFARLLYLEVSVPPTHFNHEALFCFMFLLGASMSIGRWFLFPVIQIFVGFYTDVRTGGRRKSDPPSKDETP
jgi:hypothetical protein